MYRFYLLTLLFVGISFGSVPFLKAQPCPALPTTLIDTTACEGSIINLNAIAGGLEPFLVWHDQDGNDYPDGSNVLLSTNGSCDPVVLSFNNLYINEDGCEIMSHVIEITTYPSIGIIETLEVGCSVEIMLPCANFDVQWQDLQGISGTGTFYETTEPTGSLVTFMITNPQAVNTACEGISIDYLLECSQFPCDPIPPIFVETNACGGDMVNLTEIGIGAQGTVWYDFNTDLPIEDPTAVSLEALGCEAVLYNFYAPFTNICTGNIEKDNIFIYAYPAPTTSQTDALCGAAITQNCPWFAATWTDNNGQSGEGFVYTATPGQSGTVTFTVSNPNSPFNCGDIVLDIPYNCAANGCLADAGTVAGDVFVCNNENISQAKFMTTGTSPTGYEYTILLTDGSQILGIGTPIAETPDIHDVLVDFAGLTSGVSYCMHSLVYETNNPPTGLALGNSIDNLVGDCFDIGECKSIEVFDCMSIAITTETTGEVLAIDNETPLEPADPLAGLNITANPEHGEVELQDNGDIVYIPDEGYVGTDEFLLFYTDLTGQQYGLYVVVNVVSASGTCEIQPIVVCTSPQTPVDICLTCVQNEVFILNVFQPTFPCSLEITANCVNYTPLPGMELYSPDSLVITYCSTQDPEDCLTTYAIINIGECAPTNNPPIANNDATTSNGDPVTINALNNDSDPDSDPLTISNFTQPTNGTVVQNGNNFIYTPNTGFEGTDSFTYQICDPDGLCDQATITITVIDDTPPPVCNEPDNLCVEIFPASTTFCLEFCNLSGNITVEAFHTTFDCSLDLLDNYCIQYTPLPGFSGNDMVEVIGCNDAGQCDTVYVNIQVGNCGGTPTNNPPIANNDATTTNGDPVTISALNNDSDPDGDPLTISNFTQPTNGTVVQNGNNFIYTPNASFEGTDSFTYQVCDPDGLCDQATITITVIAPTPTNNPPIANNDAATSNGGPVGINVTNNDSDPDGNPLTVTTYTQPSNGTVVLNGNSFTYTPNAGFEGTDSFTYQVCDPDGLCDQATVTITINLPDNECESITYICTNAATPQPICPEFCNIPAGSDYYIALGITNYNCLLSLAGDDCLQYTSLPLFSGQEHLMVVACTMLGICDTAHVYIQVDGCDEGGFAPNYPGEGKYIHHFEKNTSPNLSIDSNVWPQPANEYCMFNFTSSNNETLSLKVFDITGRTIQQTSIISNKGQNTATINTTQMSSGVYILQLSNGQTNLTTKFVKQ